MKTHFLAITALVTCGFYGGGTIFASEQQAPHAQYQQVDRVLYRQHDRIRIQHYIVELVVVVFFLFLRSVQCHDAGKSRFEIDGRQQCVDMHFLRNRIAVGILTGEKQAASALLGQV